MSYVVLARKFRPQKFSEVVGQEHITTTLKNAISTGRVAQSFLFSGSRGVGKTSTARILAKALNCEGGPKEEPCGKCVSCTEITESRSLDVLEIDGASNRGIDEIRSLRENVKFKPTHGKYKVYIIDEVHMLTGEAFNALLKTLEEPPEHVKFIFATTEPHKVPITILSRCQRFSFRRIPTPEIAKKLEEIAKKEKVKASKDVLFLIAKAAEGSLRDSEGLLDQLINFCGNTLEPEKVVSVLGLTKTDTYFRLLDAVYERKGKETLDILEEVISGGGDLVNFTKGLLAVFRNLLVTQVVGADEKLIETAEDELKAYEERKNNFTKETLFYIINLLQRLSYDVKRSETPKFYLEVALMKLVGREDLEPLSKLLEKVEMLEKKMGTGVISRSGARLPVDGGQAAATKPSQGASVIPAKAGIHEPKPQTVDPRFHGDDKRTKPPTVDPRFRGDDTATERPVDPQAIKKAYKETVKPAEVKEEIKKAAPRLRGDDKKTAKSKPSITLADVEGAWADIIDAVKAKKMSAGMFLSESEPVEVDGSTVILGMPSEFKFHKETLEKKDNKSLVEKIAGEKIKAEIRVKYVVVEADAQEKPAGEAPPPKKDDKIPGIVEDAIEMFGGTIVRRT